MCKYVYTIFKFKLYIYTIKNDELITKIRLVLFTFVYLLSNLKIFINLN